MKLVVQYLRQRRRVVLTAAAFVLIFVVSFSLYHLPIAAVLYPTALCTLLGLGLALLDFRRVCRRHRALQNVQDMTDVVEGCFPEIEGIEEADYQKIIGILAQKHRNAHTNAQKRYEELVNYYTVWVHQIKTPIASMRLNLQNEDTSLSRKLAVDLFRIEQYVDMVLTFLRLNADSTDYVIKEYDLDTILRQSVKKFAGEFISRGLRLEYEPLSTTVITDEKWLSFVIEQILSNALKYTPAGSIRITLKPKKKLCIQDTGIGIAPEDLPRIFENGFTGYNGRTNKTASGIGLFLCKRICSNLGHPITAESQLGQGTCICIDLNQKKTMSE